MPDNDLEKKIKSLQKEIAAMREENEILTERAEDIFLLGAVSEKIEKENDLQGIVGVAVENVSMLKDIAYGAYFKLKGGTIEVVEDFGPGMKERLKGRVFEADNEFMERIHDGDYFVVLSGDDILPEFIPSDIGGLVSNSYYFMPTIVQGELVGMFLFVNCIQGADYLRGMLPMIDRVGDIVNNRMENVSLMDQVKDMNRTLELRVHERTGKLVETNAQLGMEITERRRVEESLRESEEKYRCIYDEAQDGIVIIDSETGDIVECNREFERQAGRPVEELKKMKVWELRPPEKIETAIEKFKKVKEHAEGGSGALELQRPDGNITPIEFRSKLITINGRRYMQSISRDISERKRTEERMQLQDRVAAVGQLAAGIAHDFNNILMGIIGYADILMLDKELGDRQKRKVSAILQSGRRATLLIRQILDFSRKSISMMKPLDLRVIVKEFLKFIDRTIPENITISFECDEGGFMVNADITKMQQVLANLAVNARDAMPQGGRLVLRLARLTIESIQESPLPEVREGEWVVLTVSDNGAGIKPGILQHIFEPFFTTKVAGEGTGLGLSQVYGIIRQHNGVIDIKTDVGKGTDIIMYLPAIDQQEEEIVIEENSELPEGHGETVLVVEDNEEVRGLIETVLSRLGYTLLTASNGREAIGIFEEDSESIRLVITDVVMPEMGGVELSEILKERKPSLPIIALSGYPIGIEEDSIKDAGIEELIHKPIHINTLAEMLYKLLNKNQ